MTKEYWRLKAAFLQMYGNVCACCGEANPSFLTIDHVKGDGKQSREKVTYHTVLRNGKESKPIPRINKTSTSQFLRDAISHYQPGTYQILCYNCNFGRAHNDGICPHERECKDLKAYRRHGLTPMIER